MPTSSPEAFSTGAIRKLLVVWFVARKQTGTVQALTIVAAQRAVLLQCSDRAATAECRNRKISGCPGDDVEGRLRLVVLPSAYSYPGYRKPGYHASVRLASG